jgi:hypothetical protein
MQGTGQPSKRMARWNRCWHYNSYNKGAMKLGKKSTLITAYTALFTIAGGLLVWDFVRRQPQSPALAVKKIEPQARTVTLAKAPQPLTGKLAAK